MSITLCTSTRYSTLRFCVKLPAESRALVLLDARSDLRTIPKRTQHLRCTLFVPPYSPLHQLTRPGLSDINVTGTSSGKEGSVVVDLECSAECEDITAVGIHLAAPNGTAEYVCANIASVSEVRWVR